MKKDVGLKSFLVDVKSVWYANVTVLNGRYMRIFGDNLQEAVDNNIPKIVRAQSIPGDIRILEYPKTADISEESEDVIGYSGKPVHKKWYVAKIPCKVSTAYTKESDKYREFVEEFSVRILDD